MYINTFPLEVSNIHAVLLVTHPPFVSVALTSMFLHFFKCLSHLSLDIACTPACTLCKFYVFFLRCYFLQQVDYSRPPAGATVGHASAKHVGHFLLLATGLLT